MSSLGAGRLREAVAYESLNHITSKLASLAYGNCRDLSQVDIRKVNFKKNSVTSHQDISVSCTTLPQEYENVTTLSYPISAQLSVLLSLNGS